MNVVMADINLVVCGDSMLVGYASINIKYWKHALFVVLYRALFIFIHYIILFIAIPNSKQAKKIIECGT